MPEIIPVLRELGIGLVPFSPLGRGFLAGVAKRSEEYPEADFRRNDPRYQGENYDANMNAAASLRLDPATMRALDDALAPEKVAGRRHSDRLMSTIDR